MCHSHRDVSVKENSLLYTPDLTLGNSDSDPGLQRRTVSIICSTKKNSA